MKTRSVLLLGTAAILLGVGSFQALRSHGPLLPGVADAATGPMPPALPVPVSRVSRQTLPLYLDYPARIEPIREVTLQGKASGFLLDQTASDGADVKEGDLLYRIDPKDVQAKLDQVRAQLERDTASLDYLRSNYDRGTQLAKSGFIAKDTYDQRSSAVKQAEAALVMDQASIRAAELGLADTDIRAPFDGRLGRNRAAPGTYVNVGATPLNTLVQLSPIYVTFNPTEAELERIQKLRRDEEIRVEVTAPSAPDVIHRGRLVFVDNALDRGTGTIVARATIDNTDKTLLPGQYVRIRVSVGQIEDAKLVPQAAIGSSQFGKFVFSVGADNLVEQHIVSLGPKSGDKVAVLSGLNGSEQVIVGNLQKIGPGRPVRADPMAD